jgi:hypothetical protein
MLAVLLSAAAVVALSAPCGHSRVQCSSADLQAEGTESSDLYLLQTDLHLHSQTSREKIEDCVDISGLYNTTNASGVKWTVDQTGCQVVLSSDPDQGTYNGTVSGSLVSVSGPAGELVGEALSYGIAFPQLELTKEKTGHKADATVTTTTSYGTKPKNSAEASGVKTNAAGDLMAFIAALVMNSGMIMCCVGFFVIAKGLYPMMYTNNLALNQCPSLKTLPETRFGWITSAWKATSKDVMEDCGLDMAMLLEFMDMGMRIMATIGVPMFLIMGPMHCLFGGHPAGEDHLSYLSFGNVVNGSWLYWIHGFIVWGVVAQVQHCIFAAQGEFLKRRHTWLRELPTPRANTVLVEGIPDEYQSETKLKEFFTQMFGANKVLSTYIVKVAPAELRRWYGDKQSLVQNLEMAEADGDSEPTIVARLNADIKAVDLKLKEEQDKLRKLCETTVPNDYTCASGFVSFKDCSDVALVMSVQLGENFDEWQTSIPPEPKSVIWQDLQQGSERQAAWTLLGYGLTAGLYFAYMPAVIGITQIATTINMGPFQPLWAAFAPTMGLQFMVAFLPTFLILIFRMCFTLKDDAFAQQMLQNWYFVFQVVFVILVTAIGSNMMQFLETLIEHPTEVFPLLGKSMPYATHFYMNYLVLQWASHAMVLTRYIQLGKFWLFSKIYDEKTAREMSEPEDQDYYGIGSRSCRMTINLCIGIIYGTLSPPINLLAWVEFFICRITYGYLIPYAESKKPDLGGYFWIQQLRHVFLGNIIYCIVMVGVLLGRSTSNGPVIIAAAALPYDVSYAKV